MLNQILVMAGITSPAGSNTEIQFNNSGVFGADSDFTWNSATNVFTVKDLQLSHSGNNVTIQNTFTGADLTLMSAAGNAGGNGGTLTLKGGLNASNNPSRTGGDVIVQGGDSGSTLGSNVSVKGGTATSGNTGDVLIQDITMPKPVSGDDAKYIKYDHATASYVMDTPAGSGISNPLTANLDFNAYSANNVEAIYFTNSQPNLYWNSYSLGQSSVDANGKYGLWLTDSVNSQSVNLIPTHRGDGNPRTNGDVLTYDGTSNTWYSAAPTSGSQTPWLSDVDASGWDLTNLFSLETEQIRGVNSLSVNSNGPMYFNTDIYSDNLEIGTGSGIVSIGGGGAATSTSNGNATTITGGAGGGTSGNGGNVAINGGIPTDGNGGSITITGANAVGTNKDGGDTTITSGVATGSGVSGTTTLTTANASGSTNSGGVTITTGQADSGDAGDILIGPGTSNSGVNGKLTLECGSNELVINATTTTVTIYDVCNFTTGTNTIMSMITDGGTAKFAYFSATPVAQQSAISDVTGGAQTTDLDVEARAAIDDILGVLRVYGLIAT